MDRSLCRVAADSGAVQVLGVGVRRGRNEIRCDDAGGSQRERADGDGGGALGALAE
jgi:hypothetical protein